MRKPFFNRLHMYSMGMAYSQKATVGDIFFQQSKHIGQPKLPRMRDVLTLSTDVCDVLCEGLSQS